jgi:hypothetical protein
MGDTTPYITKICIRKMFYKEVFLPVQWWDEKRSFHPKNKTI